MLFSPNVSDEVVGFHCQQAAEKLLKAALSALAVPYQRTHDLGALMLLLARQGHRLPPGLADLDALTPFGTVYRYEDLEPLESLNRTQARSQLATLRAWVELLLSSQ